MVGSATLSPPGRFLARLHTAKNWIIDNPDRESLARADHDRRPRQAEQRKAGKRKPEISEGELVAFQVHSFPIRAATNCRLRPSAKPQALIVRPLLFSFLFSA